MADRGRDLKISILSDAERFDLAHPADELDKVAAAAKDSGTALDNLGRDAQDASGKVDAAGRDAATAAGKVDALGTDAHAAATKVDHAFDTIAAASKTKMGDGMETGADKAKASLKGVGEEAAGTARETAASFDGSAASVQDSFQEIAANALGSFGPLGAAIGLAGAVGFGMLRAQAEKTKEAISGLVSTLVDQGGKMDRGNVLDKLKEFAADGSLMDLKRQAQDAKVPVNDFLLAMAGDPAALERTRAAVTAAGAAIGAAAEGSGADPQIMLDQLAVLGKVSGALDPVAENYAAAAEAAGVYESATGGASQAQAAFNDSLGGFTDPLDAYSTALDAKEAKEQATAEKTAAATKSQTDSWEDYAGKVTVSVSDYLTELDRQVTAQENWEANMTTLAGKVSADTLEELAKLGPEGAPLVAKLTHASDAELARLVALFKRRGEGSGTEFATALAAKEADAAAAAKKLHDAAAAQLKLPLVIDLALNDKAFRASLLSATNALTKFPLLDPSRGRP